MTEKEFMSAAMMGEKRKVLQGIKEGISQGISKGKLEGEERVSRLNLILIEAKKFVELERASKDAVYRRQLFEEYGI